MTPGWYWGPAFTLAAIILVVVSIKLLRHRGGR